MGRVADNRRYHTQRTLLILLMGSRCKYCSERRPWKLEFHHTDPRAWKPHKTSRHRRIRRYMREWSEGRVVLACTKCNKRLGQPVANGDDEIPP